MRNLLLVLLLYLPSLAQTLIVVDDSPADSPLASSGAVTVDPTNPQNVTCAITGHNNGSQVIVAWRQDIYWAAGQPVTFYHRHDHFFKDQDMVVMHSPQPGADFDQTEYGLACEPFAGSGSPPAIHIKTLWVQFLDGSTWGDPDAQAYMMTQRTNAIAFMNTLLAAYNSGGEAAFTQAYTNANFRGRTDDETRRNSECMAVQAWLRDHPGITTQLAEINRRLSVAKTRASWMK